MIEPTDEMREAFYADSDERCDVPGCVDCFDDRLAAVLAVVARTRCMEAAGHVYHPLAKPKREWPPGRGGKHPHYCIRCSDGESAGPGCGICRSTGFDQTPWPNCRECRP